MTTHSLKISVRVTPGAKSTGAAGLFNDILRVRLAAPANDGKANRALLDWAAKTFEVPKSAVELLHGAASRQKCLQLHFADAAHCAAARKRLAALRGD